MFDPDTDGVFARVYASAARRMFACGVLYGLGALLIYIAFARPPALFGALFLVVFGGAVLLVAERLRRATQPRAWSPGMWWRMGRRVGIGGTVAAGPAKFMAEQIALRIATRTAD